MEFSALIFDCDGVLVDSEAIAIQAERDLLRSWGLDYGFEAFVSRFVGLHNRDFYAALAADAARLGVMLPEGFGQQLQANNWARYEAELTAIEGVADAVAAFGGPLAVASSSEAAKLVRKLEITGLHDLFMPHIYSSDLVTHGKPAPDLFLLTAEKLSAAPEGCLVIEDSVNGVTAARAAGMTAWGFTGGGHADAELAARLTDAGAHAVYATHAEIATALRGR
ncbi:HAD-IA family hydrolase [Hyphomonas sp. WL0036]|uniref:HAD family hydrolase n=1 Tax=Hyphomonas sediminis TaxID=2866160 RepID=UPI001C7E5CC3|nr:HAD-IA family hydrolase [Hyphomonas sediminis]MBY9068356.1 HAD-IA family hydrolase [Hyphomonas sediminis]